MRAIDGTVDPTTNIGMIISNVNAMGKSERSSSLPFRLALSKKLLAVDWIALVFAGVIVAFAMVGEVSL